MRSLSWVFLFAVLILVTCVNSGTQVQAANLDTSKWYLGIWEGWTTQINPTYEFTTVVSLVYGENRAIIGTIAYPELRCGGTLKLISESNDQLEFSEEITYGSNCVKNGTIEFTSASSGTAEFYWYSDSHPVIATSTLSKITTDLSGVPQPYIGIWEGTGVQQSPSTSWSILITLTKGGMNELVGTIAYPSLSCGGKLTLLSSIDNTLAFREKITYGENCVDNGTVTLELVPDSSLKFEWYDPNGQLGAYGSLTRASSEEPSYPISGHVTDSSGNPIYGVTITAAGPVTRSTTTSSSGYYEFANTPPGAYTVTPTLSHHVFEPSTAFVNVPNNGILVNFVAKPAEIVFNFGEMIGGKIYKIREQNTLRLDVVVDGDPARAFVYRIEGGKERALGYTNDNGTLFTTIDRDQSPLLGHYAPTFRAVTDSGLRIEATFGYEVRADAPDMNLLDQAEVNALNFAWSVPEAELDDILSNLHIWGTTPQISWFLLVLDLIRDAASLPGYYPQVGDVINTYQYQYDPDDSELQTVTRIDEHINRGGNIVRNATWWANTFGFPLELKGTIKVAMASPARISLTDPRGRTTGFDPDTGQIVKEIPDSYYTGPDTEPQLILVFAPIEGTYRSTAVGIGSGEVHFYTWSISESGHSQQESTAAPIVPGQIMIQTVGYREVKQLYLPSIICK